MGATEPGATGSPGVVPGMGVSGGGIGGSAMTGHGVDVPVDKSKPQIGAESEPSAEEPMRGVTAPPRSNSPVAIRPVIKRRFSFIIVSHFLGISASNSLVRFHQFFSDFPLKNPRSFWLSGPCAITVPSLTIISVCLLLSFTYEIFNSNFYEFPHETNRSVKKKIKPLC